MTRSFALFTLVLASAACTDAAGRDLDSSAETERVCADVRRLTDAVYAGDPDTVIDLTHPLVVENLGGDAAARRTLREAFERLRGQLRPEEFGFPEPPTFVRGSEHEFVVVPTHAVLSMGRWRVESRNFQFGIRRVGEAAWKYIEGSRVVQLADRIPEFPRNLEFPETWRRRIER